MEEDLEGLGVGGEDNELGDSAVEGLCGFVSSFLQLPVVGGLLDEIKDLLREGLVGKRKSFGVDGCH